jgi:2-amino-4-hydroxy-6-hydroxymethyldihydropteridine diphosphokinase
LLVDAEGPAGTEVFIGLGANLSDVKAHLKAGLDGLAALKGYEPLAVSSLYLTAPVGPVEQPPFLNAVAHGRYHDGALNLLSSLQRIEAGQGRQRIEHWGPRTLDLDLLLFGGEIIDLPELKVPHPEMWRRAFVLVPLMEIAPELTLPRWQKTAGQLYKAMTPEEREEQSVRRESWE